MQVIFRQIANIMQGSFQVALQLAWRASSDGVVYTPPPSW